MWSTNKVVVVVASQSNIHSYNTRSSSRGNYHVKHSRLDIQTESFGCSRFVLVVSVPRKRPLQKTVWDSC